MKSFVMVFIGIVTSNTNNICFQRNTKKILIMKSFDRFFFAIKTLAKLQEEETVCVLRLKTNMNYKVSLDHILGKTVTQVRPIPYLLHSNAVGT